MSRLNRVEPRFVEFVPERLDAGVLYISKRFSTASHLCCCGCGLEVVTPFGPAKWRITERSGMVSLWPSIGNWSFPCQSHYILTDNGVKWVGGMSPSMIAAVKARDRRDTILAVPPRLTLAQRAGQSIAQMWTVVADWITRRLR